jgi:hypothetical protein
MKKIIMGLLLGLILTTTLAIAPIIKVSDGRMSINDIVQLKIDCYDLWIDVDGNTIYNVGGTN